MQRAAAAAMVVVEGFLLLAAPASLRGLYDRILFLDADSDVCLARRLARNPRRTPQQAGPQYGSRSMHFRESLAMYISACARASLVCVFCFLK